MLGKEQSWMKKRNGYLSASMLDQIVSKSGKIIDTNLSAIRSKRFERNHGYSLPVSSRPMEIGNQNEPYAVDWFRENYPDVPIIYSKELPEIPFWTVDWAKFGASPDAFNEDETLVVEFKTVVSNTNVEFFADPYTSYEEKKEAVFNEHGSQIFGQFLSKESVKEIWLVKHIPQNDYNDEDLDEPTAAWRGLVFKFKREDYEGCLDEMKKRICLFDAMIDAPLSPSQFKSGEWVVEDGILRKK